MKMRLLPSIFLLPVLILMCSVPPSLNIDRLQSVSDSLSVVLNSDQIKGAADASVRIEKKRYDGNIIVDWKRDSVFHVDFYSPFGAIVASVNGDSSNLILTNGNGSTTSSSDSFIDILPFMLKKTLTYNEFTGFFIGDLSAFSSLFKQKPSSARDSGKFALASWNVESRNQIVEVLLNRKKAAVESVVIFPENKTDTWMILFKKIKSGRAHSILFKQDENNYFSIDYDNFKTSGDFQKNE